MIAAIQAMGLYEFYKLDFAAWADRIAADPSQGAHWKQVFEELGRGALSAPRLLPAATLRADRMTRG